VQAFESVSTWRQPLPPPASAERTAVIGEVAAQVAGLGPGRLRVAVDGLTAAGKTSFGHELAAELRGLGGLFAREGTAGHAPLASASRLWLRRRHAWGQAAAPRAALSWRDIDGLSGLAQGALASVCPPFVSLSGLIARLPGAGKATRVRTWRVLWGSRIGGAYAARAVGH